MLPFIFFAAVGSTGTRYSPILAVPVLGGRALEQVHLRRADEAGDEEVGGLVVELERGVDLLQVAELHHRDPVAHRHRLDLVVGDVDGGDAEVGLELGDVGAGRTRILASRFDSGSSMQNTCGLRTIARPIATRWR